MARTGLTPLVLLVLSAGCFSPGTGGRACDDSLPCADGEVCDPVRGVCRPGDPDAAAAAVDAVPGDAAFDAATSDAAPVDAAPFVCPAGYVAVNGMPHRYRLVAASGTWTAARATCLADGATLAIPDDAAELTAWIGLAPLVERVWIGISDVEVEGVYRTELGGIATYLPWGAGDPDGGTQDCVFADLKEAQPEIADSLCTGTEQALCECVPDP